MKRYIFLILIALALLGDFITTWYGVEIQGLSEQNSFITLLVENDQWTLLALIKLFQFGFFYMIIDLIEKSRSDNKLNILAKKIYPYVLIGLLFSIVIGNLMMIL